MLQASAICLTVIVSSLYKRTTKSFDVSLIGGLPVGFLLCLTFSISSTPFVHRNPIITDLFRKINPFWQIFLHNVKICSYISVFQQKKVFARPLLPLFGMPRVDYGLWISSGGVVVTPTPQPSTLNFCKLFYFHLYEDTPVKRYRWASPTDRHN